MGITTEAALQTERDELRAEVTRLARELRQWEAWGEQVTARRAHDLGTLPVHEALYQLGMKYLPRELHADLMLASTAGSWFRRLARWIEAEGDGLRAERDAALAEVERLQRLLSLPVEEE